MKLNEFLENSLQINQFNSIFILTNQKFSEIKEIFMKKPKKKPKSDIRQYSLADYYKFERKESDIPFYNETKFKVSISQIILFLLMLLFSFVALILLSVPGILGIVIKAILPLAIAYFSFLYFFGESFLNRFIAKIDDFKVILLFLFLSLFIGSLAYLGINYFTKINLLSINMPDNLLSLILNIVLEVFQVATEELIAVGMFVGLLVLGNRTNSNIKRKYMFIGSLIISSVVFSLLHLTSYTLLQCILVIATTRCIMTLVYFFKRNILYSYIVHLLYDFCVLIFAYLFIK